MKRTLLLCSLLSFGCDDPLAYPQDIDRLRVLGARASVNGDASRAWPGPGEAVSLQWLVAAPEPEPATGWHFEACPSRATSRGTPECDSPVFASAAAATPSTAPPRIDFTLPAEASERVLVRGLLCRDGLVQSLDASCAGEHERVMFEVMVGDPSRQNQNPTLDDTPIFLGGQLWPAATAAELAEPGCAPGDPALSAAVGQELEVRVELDASDRDAIDDDTDLTPPFEPLFLSNFATHGRLSRPMSVVEGDSNDFSLRTSWRAPESGAGERVRFYFVIRDGRGGVDWSTRTLCLLP